MYALFPFLFVLFFFKKCVCTHSKSSGRAVQMNEYLVNENGFLSWQPGHLLCDFATFTPLAFWSQSQQICSKIQNALLLISSLNNSNVCHLPFLWCKWQTWHQDCHVQRCCKSRTPPPSLLVYRYNSQIRKWANVVFTNTIKSFPNQKPWITGEEFWQEPKCLLVRGKHCHNKCESWKQKDNSREREKKNSKPPFPIPSPCVCLADFHHH